MRHSLELFLLISLHEVWLAKDAHDALSWISPATVLDVVISDFHVPGMSGVEFLVEVSTQIEAWGIASPNLVTLKGAIDLGIPLEYRERIRVVSKADGADELLPAMERFQQQSA